ncbi:hypothetical protein GGS24DRAFT_514118 [Hypoxylon argillaceum]|nr:hypothetical protein GGS24DRAFT_514118 [Hypoxylon argillaceum]
MHSGVSKARARRSRIKLSKSLQEQLLVAAARKDSDHPQSYTGQPQVSIDLNRATVPVQSTKRPLDALSEIDLLPAKRARLELTDAQQPSVEDDEVERVSKTTLQQPKPEPPKRPYARFLQDFLDPIRPDHPGSVRTFISDWLESVGSDREKHCRSDSYLHYSDEPVPRQLTRSAPEMGFTVDADGFAVPPTPASTGSRSYAVDVDTVSAVPSDITGSARSAGKSLVADPLYRSMNLADNNVYMRSPHEKFPEYITSLVNEIRKDRESPGLSLEQVRQDSALAALQWAGAGEAEVEEYFRTHIFHYPGTGASLQRNDKQPMARHIVPNSGSKFKISNPVPDMLYGYSYGAFTRGQQAQFISMGKTMVANNHSLFYPFLVIEFKGDGPSGGGTLWVAANQCLGGSVSCVNVAESLNHHLKQCKGEKGRPINSAAFSIAMSGTEARLNISWKHNELDYYMATVESFLLQNPKHYLKFRKYVQNIIDWGKNKRLNEIRDSLDIIMEEGRRRASEAAKARQSPSDGSATSKGKKYKPSSHQDSSASGSVQK